MKVTRYINGQKIEKKEFDGIRISNEIISSTIAKVNKRNILNSGKGISASNE